MPKVKLNTGWPYNSVIFSYLTFTIHIRFNWLIKGRMRKKYQGQIHIYTLVSSVTSVSVVLGLEKKTAPKILCNSMLYLGYTKCEWDISTLFVYPLNSIIIIIAKLTNTNISNVGISVYWGQIWRLLTGRTTTTILRQRGRM